MSDRVPQTPERLNQSPPFEDVNLYETDIVLRDCVAREGAGGADAGLASFGARAGSAETAELARRADVNPPRLHDPVRGIVAYDKSYHDLMRISMSEGLHCSTWKYLPEGVKPEPGVHVRRCAGFFMAAQMEAGHCCPLTMTHAALAALAHQRDLLLDWFPKVLAREYDPAFSPVAGKASATLGMGMTEIQGGTDVRANLTKAEPDPEGGEGAYRITGHKYFLSAPMSDAFLVLAQAPGGLTCFLMPRFSPDGRENGIRLLRLKDKLGNRSNASSEAEFHNAHARLVGREGRGVSTILDMVTLTRLDCAVSSAGLMRKALAQAIHHCRHRKVFAHHLIDRPLMQRVLAGMAIHVEAATRFAFRLARAFDGGEDEHEAAYRRLMTPVAKYWVCKSAPAFAFEAMECLGGIGYVEDAMPLARLYREVPVNAIWEGSGNVMCLDVLRVVEREPNTFKLVLAGLEQAARGEAVLEGMLERIRALAGNSPGQEADGRNLTELLARLGSGILMRSHAPDGIADAYLGTCLAGSGSSQYGATGTECGAGPILERALP